MNDINTINVAIKTQHLYQEGRWTRIPWRYLWDTEDMKEDVWMVLEDSESRWQLMSLHAIQYTVTSRWGKYVTTNSEDIKKLWLYERKKLKRR